MSSEVSKAIEQKRKEIAELESQVARADLMESVTKNPKMADDKLYPLAKAFCNRVEKNRREAKKKKED